MHIPIPLGSAQKYAKQDASKPSFNLSQPFSSWLDLPLTLVKVTRVHTSQCNGLLMLPSVGLFLQLFVTHLVRMVFVTDLATVPVSLGGPAADAE